MEDGRQETLWVLRAQCGDREAFELLLRGAQPFLRRYLAALLGPADADDVLQDVFLLVFRKLVWLQDPELFRPWVLRIASRAAFRHLRRTRRETSDREFVEEVGAIEPSLPEGLLSELERGEAASPASRSVLLLHFREGLSLQDVAAVLELPLGTVKSRLAYGLTLLRKRLEAKKGS